jgi:hypothetical protein
MAGQRTLLAYFGGAAGTRLRDEGSSALVTRRLLTVAARLTASFFTRTITNLHGLNQVA